MVDFLKQTQNKQQALIKQITQGESDGEYFYICDIRTSEGGAFKKLLRNVPPTKVLCRSNELLPKSKRIYYSESHFVEVKEFDKIVKSRVISIYDNTGYRTYAGVPVFVFTSREECEKVYKIQVDLIVKEMEYEMKCNTNTLKDFKDSVELVDKG